MDLSQPAREVGRPSAAAGCWLLAGLLACKLLARLVARARARARNSARTLAIYGRNTVSRRRGEYRVMCILLFLAVVAPVVRRIVWYGLGIRGSDVPSPRPILLPIYGPVRKHYVVV